MWSSRKCSQCGKSQTRIFINLSNRLICHACGVSSLTRRVQVLCSSSPIVSLAACSVRNIEEVPRLFAMAEDHLTKNTLFGKYLALDLAVCRERIQRCVAPPG